MANVETTFLATDHEISRVIKGGWQLAGDHGSVDRAEAIRDMEAFLDAGITTFDCADIYTGVEDMIGTFISEIRTRRGAAVANRIRVHTKLVPDLTRLHDLRPGEVTAIVERSLRRLSLEQLDLVQFYWWDLQLGSAVDALGVLLDLRDAGKIRHLAVTNWDRGEIEPFLAAGFDLVSNQVQYSLLDRRPAGSFAAWSAQEGMSLLCYGTLAGGFLTEAWLGAPDPGFEFANRSLVKYRLIIDEFGPWERFQELLSTLKSIGDQHGVSLSAVATRWVLDQPGVAAAIVGARYARHLPKTLEVFAMSLTEDDHDALSRVLERSVGPQGGVFALERDREGRHGRIMKYNLNNRPGDGVHALGAKG
ncbi:MAG: aldo/keto reductase [Pseudomonadota bacterium]